MKTDIKFSRGLGFILSLFTLLGFYSQVSIARDIIVTLKHLHCIRESDGSGHSEPYIWPALLWIDESTLEVGVTDPGLENARIMIKDEMRAGDTADIPTSVGVLRVPIEDGSTNPRLILVVVLWEKDDTPGNAVRAGFQAFSRKLRDAVAENLLAFGLATSQAQRDSIIGIIATDVASEVRSAIENSLTDLQKPFLEVGGRSPDDVIAVDFQHFPDLLPIPITLTFLQVDSSNHYEIEGALQVPEGLFVSTDGSGNIPTIKQHTDWDRDWDLIIPGNFGGDAHTDLLFYKQSVGEGLFVSTDGAGNIPTIKQHTNWDRDWDLIIPGNFGGDAHTDLLFYKRSVGLGLFVSTDGAGNIPTIKQHTDWDRDWDLIIPGNFGGDAHTDLLFYKRSVGLGLFVSTDGAGNIPTIKQHTDWDRDWDLIIPGSFGGSGFTGLLFYKGIKE
jgi:hypothetical protein